MEPQITGVAVGVVVASLPWSGFIAVTRTLNSLSHCDGLTPGIPEFSHHCLMSVAFSYLTFECCLREPLDMRSRGCALSGRTMKIHIG